MEAEPGDVGQHNADITDVDTGSVVQQESYTPAAARHRRHAETLRQQEGTISPPSSNGFEFLAQSTTESIQAVPVASVC